MRWLKSAAVVFLLAFFAQVSLGAEKTLSPAPDGSFCVVVIPDTQEYTGRGTKAQPKSEEDVQNESLVADVHWISDNLERQHIVFVSHVGDIVDRNVPEQWEVARRAMDVLQGRVPYGIAVGNHDMKSSGDSSLFQKYFPASCFKGTAWYGGMYAENPLPNVSGNNANSYQLFSAAGMDFLFLHLECNAPDDVLHWADQVLDSHPDRRAFVTTHMGLGPIQEPKTREGFLRDPKGRMQWSKCHGEHGNSPEAMWSKCFCKHDNLGIVFSGDQSRTEAMHQSSRNDHGKVVHEIMSDYNHGWLRIYRFVPRENAIQAWTVYSRTGALCKGTKYVPDESQHQFTLDYEMKPSQCRK